MKLRVDTRVSLLYIAFAGLWIVFSDELLAGLARDAASLSRLQAYTGWAFVAAGGLLVFRLLRREWGRRQSVEGDSQGSESLYHLLFENSPDAILLSAPDGSILAANPAACHMLEYTEPELMQLGFQGLGVAWGPRFYTGGVRAELTLRRKDKTQFPAEVSIAVFTDKEGMSHTSLILRDITARKQAESQMQRQIKFLNSLHVVDIAILSSSDLPLLFDIMLQELHTQLGVDAAVILLFHPGLKVLEYAASRGLGATAIQHVKGRAGGGYASRVIQTRKTIRNPGFKQRGGDPTPTMILANEAFVDYFGVPLIVKGDVKGVLEIYHHSALQADPDWFQFLETLAGQAAIAIDHAQSVHSLQQPHTNLK